MKHDSQVNQAENGMIRHTEKLPRLSLSVFEPELEPKQPASASVMVHLTVAFVVLFRIPLPTSAFTDACCTAFASAVLNYL